MKVLLPDLRSNRGSAIVGIASINAILGNGLNPAYSASKAGLLALSRSLADRLAADGIRVNTICPGMVLTEMSEGAPGLDRRRCLYPADIADLALWLLTRRANIKIGRPILIQTMLNPWEGK